MPRPLSAAGRAALAAQRVAVCYFLEVTPDEGTQRTSSWGVDLTYDGQTWGAGQNKWHPSDGIPISKGLVPETFNLSFDGADETDTSTFIGLLLTRTWHQRPIRLYCVLLDTNDYSVIDTFFEWRGKMDRVSVSSDVGAVANIVLSCESGVFRAQERNLVTVSHNDQKRRDPTDTLFANMVVKQNQEIPYGISWSKVPGSRGGGTSGGDPFGFGSQFGGFRG